MKRWIMLLFMALLLGGLCTAHASGDILSAQSDALDLQGIQQAAGDYGAEFDMEEGISLDEGISYTLATGSDQILGIFRKARRSGLLMLVVVILCGVASGMYSGVGAEGSSVDVVKLVGVLAVTAIAVTDVHSLIGMGREAIADMDNFSKVLIPAVTAAAAASGAPGVAVARQFCTMLFSDILITVINRLLLPLVYAYIAASVAFAAVGNEGLKRIGTLIKWVVNTVLAGILIVYVGYLTISGAVAGTVDATAVKAAKLTVSGMIPVVGGILSDAAESVLVGVGLLKNTVGVFGMIVILCICLAPFLTLGIHYLVYKIFGTLSATVSDGGISKLIDQIGGVFGLVLGMAGACAFVLLISLVTAVTAVSGG
ncbi:MAG: stage III sporulation protein AE [Oscillospiraceae bacterium]|nr:stage III sporulation protein AE [Oscillospiraceae bacterium]